ncbi:MAG: hypothetical protein Q8N23_34160 [Archangium sp.]|nr:hypothetical protein [Archangium sp.]MDP3575284.1 hypothetical protein [Archangium sp.]
MAVVLMVTTVRLFGLGGEARAADYPHPPFDFAHPSNPHGDIRSSPTGGNEDRPILVIYPRWDDVDYPPGWDGAFVANRFFGTGFPSITFPSVGDYYRRLSFNKLFLFPAAETQGTAYDGIVQVSVPGTKAAFFLLTSEERNKRLIQLADPDVDFSSFDSDGNGSLSNMELIINVLEAAPETAFWEGCGIARGVNALSLDGVNLSGLLVAMNNTATNLITIIHENAHVALDMVDLYGFDVGKFDIGAATCSAQDTQLWAPNAWNKMHWGWITPTVVDHDGYFEVRRADTTGDAFLLYDPDHGTDDYFMIENRRPTAGTYDRGVGDDGLVIWRIADAALGISTPLELVRPTASAACWDASDATAPQRTMQSAWIDGTPSNLAVRAIGRRGEVIRAYFDVRGPGVLVDTYALDSAAPLKVTAGGANVFNVPELRNTGETGCDTFLVEPSSLPAGWTMSPGLRILCAGEANFAQVTLTPDANAAVGVYDIAVRAHSQSNPSLASESPLSVEVVLRSTRFGLADLLAVAPASSQPTFQVRLVAEDDPTAGLPGIVVTFTLTGPGGTVLVLTATTDANGVATATAPVLTLAPGAYSLTITTPRVGALAASTSTVVYEVLSTRGTIQRVADQLTARIATATSASVRSTLEAGRDELIGNHNGASSNGADDKLAAGDPVSALTKLRTAVSKLLIAEAAGAGDLGQLKDLLGLSAEAIANAAYAKAVAAIPSPKPSQVRTLVEIASFIAAGQAALLAHNQLAAIEAFRQATSLAVSLSK